MFQIRIRVLKVRIRPFINLCDLNDGFDKVLEDCLTKKDGVKSARYEIKHFFPTFTLIYDVFFTDPDISGSDPDF